MKFRTLFILLFTLLLTNSMFAKAGFTSVYVFGFGMDFNDSTVYLTEIQKLDTAYIGKGNMLYNRTGYSNQLQQYLIQSGVSHPTCIISFSDKARKIEKKYLKLKKKYLNDGKHIVKYITPAQFKYTAQKPTLEELEADKVAAEKAKAAKAKAKAERKAAKKRQKMMDKGIIVNQQNGKTALSKKVENSRDKTDNTVENK